MELGETAPIAGRLGKRKRRQRGSELLEFTLVILPLLAMITVLVDTAWGIFAESTLQRAVRLGVRMGVTLTASSDYWTPRPKRPSGASAWPSTC